MTNMKTNELETTFTLQRKSEKKQKKTSHCEGNQKEGNIKRQSPAAAASNLRVIVAALVSPLGHHLVTNAMIPL